MATLRGVSGGKNGRWGQKGQKSPNHAELSQSGEFSHKSNGKLSEGFKQASVMISFFKKITLVAEFWQS